MARFAQLALVAIALAFAAAPAHANLLPKTYGKAAPACAKDCKPVCQSVTTPVCNKVPQQNEACADVPVYTKVPICQDVCEDYQVVCNGKGKHCKAVPAALLGHRHRRSLSTLGKGDGLLGKGALMGKGALLVGKAAPVVSQTTQVCKKICEYQVQTNYVKQCKTVTTFQVVCNDVTQQVCKNVCTTTCVEEQPVLAGKGGAVMYGKGVALGKGGLYGKRH